MKTVQYTIGPQMGQPKPYNTSGSLTVFLSECIGVIENKLIPPFQILNQILKSGADLNRNCQWQPFELDEQDYRELVLDLLISPASCYEQVTPADWVSTPKDWYYWCCEYRVGIPAQKHRELLEESEMWSKKARQASEEGSKELAESYHWKSILAGQQLMDLVMPYFEKNLSKNHWANGQD